jgi:hypothetical protein
MDPQTEKELMEMAPSYSIPLTFKEVAKVTDYLIEDKRLSDKLLGGAVLDETINALTNLLYSFRELDIDDRIDVQEAQEEAVGSIVRLHAGTTLDKQTIIAIAHKFVTWKDKLDIGEPFVPWVIGDKPIWTAVRITEVAKTVQRKGYGFRVTFKSFSNRSCGLEWVGIYSPTGVRYVGSKLGFPRFPENPPNPYDISGMWFTTLLRTAKGNQLVTDLFATSSSMKEANRKLFRERQEPCRKDPVRQCFNCHLGRNDCTLARRPHTFTEQKQCANYEYGDHGEHIYHEGYIEDVAKQVCYVCLLRGKFNKEVRGIK